MDDTDVIVISCLWCSNVSFVSERLHDYVQARTSGESGSGRCEQWVSDATQDLCSCSDCVDEYHRALEKAFQDDPRFTIKLKKLVYASDVARLEKCLGDVLAKCKLNSEELSEEEEEDMVMFWSTQRSSALQQEFECPMLEILKYPRFLLNRRVNELFVSALDEMETIDRQLEVHGKYPGVYLLLVHPNQKVRRWSVDTVQNLGQVDWDDYDSLEEVLSWMATVITFDQFDDPQEEAGATVWDDSQDIVLLPKHAFVHESRKDFWIGVCMLITALSGPCIRSRLVSNREDLIQVIINALDCNMSSSEGFWPALQCLRTLLHKLGSRFWQFVPRNSSFDYVLRCVLKSPQFKEELAKWSEESQGSDSSDADDATNSQVVYDYLEETLDAQPTKSVSLADKTSSIHRQRLPFTWIIPFLQSLLDFGEAAYKAIGDLFRAVHSFPSQLSNPSPLFNESLFTLSQMIQLLFSKGAYSIMYAFKDKWLLAVKIALDSVKDISSLSSLKYLFNVLLGILDTDEAKELPKNKEIVSYLQKFAPSLKSPHHQRGGKIPPSDIIISHVVQVLKILEKTHTSPTPSFLGDQLELPPNEIEQQEQQAHDLGAGGLGDINVKEEPNIEDSPSDAPTFSGSIADHRPSHSKVKSVSQRKATRVHRTIHVRKKPDVSPRMASSSDSTDELEDFELPTQIRHAKQKHLPVRQSKHAGQKSPLRVFLQKSPSNIAKVKVPQLRVSDDTTDDMEGDTKPISDDDDNVFESVNKLSMQSSKLSSKSSPVSTLYQSREPHRQNVQQTTSADATPVKKALKLSLDRYRSSSKHNPKKVLTQQTQKISTLSVLLGQSKQKLPQRSSADTGPMKKASVLSHKPSPKSDSMDVQTPSQRLSMETHLSPAKEVPMPISSSNTPSLSTTTHQQYFPSVTTIDLSTDDLKEFERFSDTETGDDISTLKQERQVRKRFPSSTDADTESGNESQGYYQQSSKKEKSVKKVDKWQLDISSEGNMIAEDITQPDSQASMIEQLTGNPQINKVICDTYDQQSKHTAQLELVSSSQELRDIEAEQSKNNKDTSQSDKDRYTPESTSSTSSSLPPVEWEQSVHPITVTKPEKSVIVGGNVEGVLNSQLQSALISTSSDKLSSSPSNTSAIDIRYERGQSDVSLQKDIIVIDDDHNEISSNQLDEQDTSEEVHRVENNLHEESMKGIATISIELVPDTNEDSESESMSIGSPMEVMCLSELAVTEDDTEFERAVNRSEASHDLPISEQYSHSLSHSSIDKSNMPIKSKTSEQWPASTSPAHQITKRVVEGAKPMGRKVPGKILLTEVPGMTYSSRKAILKRNYLPDPIQSPLTETQSSGTSSLKLSHMNQTERSLPERHFRIQSSDASVTIKKSLPLPTSSATLATGKAEAKCKGITSHLPKKIQPSSACPNTSSPSALSVSTQNLLDSIGRPSTIANIGSKLRSKHPPSFNPAKKCIPLMPKVLPKVDDFSREVLSWDPTRFLYPQQAEDGKLVEPKIQLKEELVKVPSIEPFESFDRYLSTFKPLIFHELWSAIFNDIHEPDVPKPDPSFGNILSVTKAGPRLQVMKWKAFISRDVARNNAHPAEDDLVVVDFSQVSEHVYSSALHLSGKDLQFRFAMVESVTKDFSSRADHSRRDPNYPTQQCVLVLTLKVSDLEFATTSELLDGSEVELKIVTSLKTVRRQWNGLINLHSSILVRDIISPRGGAYFCCPAQGSEALQNKLTANKKYNDSQMNAIQSVVEAVSCSFAHPRICLLHGPPGTGKTHTISGMVSALLTELNRSSHSHLPKSALPGQHTTALKPTRPRVLICTPSNNAVDEIIRKLMKSEVITVDKHVENQDPTTKGTSCSNGRFNLVRIGKPERIHSELSHLSLDYQAKKLLAKNSSADTATDLNDIRSQLQNVESEVVRMEKHLHILELAHKSASTAGPQIKSDIDQLKERLTRYNSKRQELSRKYKDAKVRNENNIRGDVSARKAILMRADIICSTLSGSASSALRDCRNNLKFSCIIIDESSQCTELDALIPLKYMCSKIVLVGDPCQLQAVVKSKVASQYGYGQSLLKRFCNHFNARSTAQGSENPIHVLKIQYRMYPEICDFPSRHFYGKLLETDKSLTEKSKRSAFHPFLIFDVVDGTEVSGKSVENVEEAALVVDLVKVLLDKEVYPRSIGVITPYKAQVKRIQNKLKER